MKKTILTLILIIILSGYFFNILKMRNNAYDFIRSAASFSFSRIVYSNISSENVVVRDFPIVTISSDPRVMKLSGEWG